MKKTFFAVLLLISLTLSLVGCNHTFTTSGQGTGTSGGNTDTNDNAETMELLKGTVYVEIEMEDGGKIKLALYADIAPITVTNFVNLANEKFYDGLTFHRIYKGFMIQGGCPQGNGYGGSDKNIKGEFAANGVPNSISHKRGVISMARSNNPNSASSQFFICHADSEFLDGSYAAFGEVIEGMDVVDQIADTPVTYSFSGEKTFPVVPVVIKTVRVVEG